MTKIWLSALELRLSYGGEDSGDSMAVGFQLNEGPDDVHALIIDRVIWLAGRAAIRGSGRYVFMRTSTATALSTVFSFSSHFALSAGVSDLRAAPSGIGRL
jgi:hypothetical protein